MVLSKEGANLPVLTTDSSEELQDKCKTPEEALGSEVSLQAPAWSVKESIIAFLVL